MNRIHLNYIGAAPWLKLVADDVFKLRIFPEIPDCDVAYVIRALHVAHTASIDLIGFIQKYFEYGTILEIAFVFEDASVLEDASDLYIVSWTHVKRNDALPTA